MGRSVSFQGATDLLTLFTGLVVQAVFGRRTNFAINMVSVGIHGYHIYGVLCWWSLTYIRSTVAAMPSLHFGYSLMIGITITTIPLPSQPHRSRTFLPHFLNFSHPSLASKVHRSSWQRIVCIVLGITYPFTILVAIVATANHFILDAVAGAIICGLGWWGNSVLLNLLPLEDYLFWILRIHKPEQGSICLRPSFVYDDSDEDQAMILWIPKLCPVLFWYAFFLWLSLITY